MAPPVMVFLSLKKEMTTMHPRDLRFYTEEILALLYEHVPDWRAAIDAERTRRAEAEAFWNSAQRITHAIAQEVDYRLTVGYSANEEARGVDERESLGWQEARKRVRFLHHRSLRRMLMRHRKRVRQ